MKRLSTKIRRHAVAALFALSVFGVSPSVMLASTTAGIATSPPSSGTEGIWEIGGVEVPVKGRTQ